MAFAVEVAAAQYISGTKNGKSYSFTTVWIEAPDGTMPRAQVNGEVHKGDTVYLTIGSDRNGGLYCRVVKDNPDPIDSRLF